VRVIVHAVRRAAGLILCSILIAGCSGDGNKPTTPTNPVAVIDAAAPAPDATPAPPDAAAAAQDIPLPTADDTRKIADTACPAVTGAYYFTVTKNGKTSHLLGTRHLSVDIAKFPSEITDALAAASLAVFETAPDDHSDRALAAPASDPIPDALGPDLWQHYQDLVGAPLAERLAGTDAPTALLMMAALYEDKTSALDDQLIQLAQKQGIRVQGLETTAFQEKLIRHWLDMRALIAAVKVTPNRAELEQTTIDDLTDYCAGTDDDPGPDPKEKQDLLDGGYTEAEITQYTEDLVFSRNRDWIPKLEKLFKHAGVFVAVGADHLVGDTGVVALLGKRGYKVTRVFPPASSP